MFIKKRKIACIVLSFVLVITLIPEISFAAPSEEGDTGSQTSGVITAFEPLETDSYYYEGDPSEEDITLKLPKSINVYLDGSDSATAVNVSWEAVEDFDRTEFYFYSMKPVWDSSYVLSPDLSPSIDVPWITVYKQEPDSENEPMLGEDELDPIYVNEQELEEESGATPVDENVNSDPAPAETESTDETNSDDTALLFDILAENSYADSSNTDKIYAYLTGTMGLNKAAACGVMTNINAESAMNPINLENSYNSLFGLTDTEYTKRVDAGKGAYKTRSGKSRNFKTDYCGYGLCQWTSLSRRKALLSRALSQGTSVGNINMQMSFLNSELRNSYGSVYSTLKSVPNTAQGAYIAAFVFCQSFEIPANTINTATSRARTCLSSGGYWKKYSGSSASTTSSSFLSLCGYTYPSSLKTGNGMTCSGYAISNYKLTKVSAVIKNSSGSTKYSASASPGTTTYSFNKFDDSMKFSKLPSGSYTYTVSAKDSKGKTVSQTHSFKVSSSGSTSVSRGFCCNNNSVPAPAISISGYNYPSKIYKGNSYKIKGNVTSNSDLSSVQAIIKDSKGNTVQSATMEPGAKTCSLADIASKLNFSSLSTGSYSYLVSARNQTESRTLINKTFKVITAPYIKVNSFTYPTSIKKGHGYDLKGKISSNYPLKEVRIRIYTSTGKLKMSARKTLSTAKTYNVSVLDSKIKFGKLPRGTYYYKLSAKNSEMSQILIYKKFKVK